MFKRGDKIRENRQGGETFTVLSVEGTTVRVYELNSTLHITKVVRA